MPQEQAKNEQKIDKITDKKIKIVSENSVGLGVKFYDLNGNDLVENNTLHPDKITIECKTAEPNKLSVETYGIRFDVEAILESRIIKIIVPEWLTELFGKEVKVEGTDITVRFLSSLQ